MKLLFHACTMLFLVFGGYDLRAEAKRSSHVSAGQRITAELLVNRQDSIWGLDFLDESQLIFTERSGSIGIFDLTTNKVTSLANVPSVYAKGQGGLLDIRVHPEYAKNGLVFVTFAEKVGSKATTAIGKFSIKQGAVAGFQKIFSAIDPTDENVHFGSRIEIVGEFIYMTIGDRGERDSAQDLMRHTGKILRLDLNGQPAIGNPFVGNKKALPEIWSYGHRNPQGLAYDSETKALWAVEHGPRGGDELNLIQAGKNYGWPVATYGREYWGPKIGEGPLKPGIEPPIQHYVPSISPSGLVVYRGSAFPGWQGNLIFGCLSGQQVRRVVVDGNRVVKEESLFADWKTRFRSVRVAKNGYIFLGTDDGRIYRLVPQK